MSGDAGGEAEAGAPVVDRRSAVSSGFTAEQAHCPELSERTGFFLSVGSGDSVVDLAVADQDLAGGVDALRPGGGMCESARRPGVGAVGSDAKDIDVDESEAWALGDSLRLSSELLRAVVGGAAHHAVAARFGLSRTAVQRRVRVLAQLLIQAGGVPGLSREGAAYSARLRHHRQELLQALDRLAPETITSPRSGRLLSAEEIELGAQRIAKRCPRAHHDAALYRVAMTTGLRPLELARLRVGDYLLSDGSVLRESQVRREAAIHGRARPLFFCNPAANEALDAYLGERARRGQGRLDPGGWRGLDPASALFLGHDGAAYRIEVSEGLGRERYVCRGMLEACRRIMQSTGILGMSIASARLTLMWRMYRLGASEDQIGLVLGISEPRGVRAPLAELRLALPALFAALG